MDFNVLSNLIYNLFVTDFFGSEPLFGLGVLVLVGYIAFRAKMSFTGFAITFVFTLLFLSGFKIIPYWIGVVVAMVLLLIVGLGILRIGRR